MSKISNSRNLKKKSKNNNKTLSIKKLKSKVYQMTYNIKQNSVKHSKNNLIFKPIELPIQLKTLRIQLDKLAWTNKQ